MTRSVPNVTAPSGATRSTPLRVLFVCTGNAARSQMAEALLTARGGARFAAASAGARPAARISTNAVAVLREIGIEWKDRKPRPVHGLQAEHWDLLITVCDDAREWCPVFPGGTAQAHWSLPDPAAAEGDEAVRREVFRRSRDRIARLVDSLVALPLEGLPAAELARRVDALATTVA